jgi:hypothetical protein
MRFFPLLDFQHWVLAFFLGLTAVILVYLAFSSYQRRRADGKQTLEEPRSVGEVEGDHADEDNPVTPFLKVVYACVVAAALGYMIVVGILGGAF